jgi:hypothetical protein
MSYMYYANDLDTDSKGREEILDMRTSSRQGTLAQKKGYSTMPSHIPSSNSPKLSSSYLRSELGNQAEIIQLASPVVITRFYREALIFVPAISIYRGTPHSL